MSMKNLKIFTHGREFSTLFLCLANHMKSVNMATFIRKELQKKIIQTQKEEKLQEEVCVQKC